MGLILYGPALLWSVWPIAVLAIAIAGAGLAFFRLRYESAERRFATSRLAKFGRLLLFGYAAVLAVMWLVWLLGAR